MPQPSLAFSNNDVHIVWNNAPGQYNDTHYRKRAASGWGTETEINTETNNEAGGLASIAIDSKDNIHVVWTYLSGSCFSIKYREYTTSWQPTQDLEGPTPYIECDPVIAIDGKDQIHVVWSGKHSDSPTYSQLRYRGYTSSWQPIENLTFSTSENQLSPSLMWALYPTINGVKTNRPEDGCSFIWMDGTTIRFATTIGIRVIQPNGGETWAVGSRQNITWVSYGVVGNVNILLSSDGGSSWQTIASSTPNDGSESCLIVGPPTTQAKIKIASVTDLAIFDTSDQDFTILAGSHKPVQKVTPPIKGNWTPSQYFAEYLEGVYRGITYDGYHSAEDWQFQGKGISGAKIFSIAEGTVAWKEDLGARGYLIAIEHPGPFNIPGKSGTSHGETYQYPSEVVPEIYSIYVHVTPKKGLEKGSSVRAGEEIAQLADMTVLTPHLHFEIRCPDQMPSQDWTMVYYPEIGNKSNWQTDPNTGKFNGYYKHVQPMVDAGLRDPTQFLNANE